MQRGESAVRQLSNEQLRTEQVGDPSLARVLEWEQVRQQADYAAILDSSPELTLMHSQSHHPQRATVSSK